MLSMQHAVNAACCQCSMLSMPDAVNATCCQCRMLSMLHAVNAACSQCRMQSMPHAVNAANAAGCTPHAQNLFLLSCPKFLHLQYASTVIGLSQDPRVFMKSAPGLASRQNSNLKSHLAVKLDCLNRTCKQTSTDDKYRWILVYCNVVVRSSMSSY